MSITHTAWDKLRLKWVEELRAITAVMLALGGLISQSRDITYKTGPFHLFKSLTKTNRQFKCVARNTIICHYTQKKQKTNKQKNIWMAIRGEIDTTSPKGLTAPANQPSDVLCLFAYLSSLLIILTYKLTIYLTYQAGILSNYDSVLNIYKCHLWY